ncbi:MAG TPA: 23S rRNA (guanosine(2251)-2'-O)-methyltransferase RlmB [Candidatus Akkermansia intestinigallinarum]|uniref:23S rRNA (Guanosine(2251)-2'-O)-methyltransferase RlmB n=1 Tax=Candidatus Akkermansia intestinigallinarum TaxID=2838431 RepID=A0A9D1VBZ9_9BACT|nr:23S rRNA (guanosine(2251)-2'-O)-methyltransferase RlmB [Candidatus Akkermansia intestinigallinarum]
MNPNGKDRTARPNKHTARSESRFEKTPTRTVVKSLDEGALADILSRQPQGLYLVLDCIQDPHNLGAILRTADGAGVAAVIAPKDKSVGITETVLRVSVGAAEKVPFVQVTNLARTMKALKEAGLWFVGTSDHGDRSLYETDLRGGIAIVMGAEGDGMRRLTEENCDFLVRIPMHGSVPCLNVSVATGVCLYEALRQRESAGEHDAS